MKHMQYTYIVRNPYSIVMKMPAVVKVTSKGQLTLPVKYRKDLDITKGSYLLVDEAGDYLLLKKIKKLDEITKILSTKAKEKGITREDILKTLGKIQAEKWKT